MCSSHQPEEGADSAASLRVALDPVTGEPRAIPVGTCAVCHFPVLPDHEPISVELLDVSLADPASTARRSAVIHGSFDCMDAGPCPETAEPDGEWNIHCLLPEDHPGDCYWSEP